MVWTHICCHIRQASSPYVTPTWDTRLPRSHLYLRYIIVFTFGHPYFTIVCTCSYTCCCVARLVMKIAKILIFFLNNEKRVWVKNIIATSLYNARLSLQLQCAGLQQELSESISKLPEVQKVQNSNMQTITIKYSISKGVLIVKADS